MNKFLFACWSAFWGSLFTLTLLAWLAPPISSPAAAEVAAPSTQTKSYTLSDVAKHASGKDCWIAVDGAVYDITAYLPSHPAPPAVLLNWCGKEASKAWHDKGYGGTHSPAATQALLALRIGSLTGG